MQPGPNDFTAPFPPSQGDFAEGQRTTFQLIETRPEGLVGYAGNRPVGSFGDTDEPTR